MSKGTILDSTVNNQTSADWANSRSSSPLRDSALVAGASVLMAVCAHVSLPLVFSPVPLTLQTFGVLLIGLTLGSKRGFAALTLYLMEGASGLPVFSPAGVGGVAQILGPTGGFLMAYPVVAYLAGFTFEQERVRKLLEGGFGAAVCAALIAEVFLFTCGMSWLRVITGVTFVPAAMMAVAPFIPGEVLKIAAVAAIASRFNRHKESHERLQQI